MLQRTGARVSPGPGVPRSSCAHYLQAPAKLAFFWFDFSFVVHKVRVTTTRKLHRGETENDGEGSRGRNEAQKKKKKHQNNRVAVLLGQFLLVIYRWPLGTHTLFNC